MGPRLIIVPVVIMMMPPPIFPIWTGRVPGLLIPRAAPARAIVIRGTIPVSTIRGIAMVRVAPYDSTDQEENHEGVLEEGVSYNLPFGERPFSYTNTVPTYRSHKLPACVLKK